VQARWVAQVMAGRLDLPSKDEMHRAIATAGRATAERFPKDHYQLPYLVAQAQYLDGIAEEMGCMPSIRDLRDPPELLRAFYDAPFTPLQYRIVGPGKLPDARMRMLALPRQSTRSRPEREGLRV
jgi:hypothetical protein